MEENGLMAVTQQLAQIGASGPMINQRFTETGSCDVPMNSGAPVILGLSLTPTITPVGSPVQSLLPPQSHSYPGSPIQPQYHQQPDITSISSTARRDLFQVCKRYT